MLAQHEHAIDPSKYDRDPRPESQSRCTEEPGRGMEARAPTISKVARGRLLAASLPVWVLAGALLGILAGLTFGERMAVLQPAGVVYAIAARERGLSLHSPVRSLSAWAVSRPRARANSYAPVGCSMCFCGSWSSPRSLH